MAQGSDGKQRLTAVASMATADPGAATALEAEVAFDPGLHWAVDDATVRTTSVQPARFWRDALRRRMLALADMVAAAAATALLLPSGTDPVWILAFLPVWLLLAKVGDLYDRDHRALRHLTLDEFGPLATWAAFGTTATALLLPLTPSGDVSAIGALGAGLVAMATAFLLRGAMRWLWRRFTPPERTLVMGDGDLAHAVRRKLTLFPDMHLRLTRVLPITDAENVEIDDGADRVIVASHDISPSLVSNLVSSCRERGLKISVVSPLRGRARPSAGLSQVADLPVLEYETGDVSRSTMMIKRVFDIVVGGATLLLTLPLFPLIALAIRLESRGGVFFIQTRAGLDGRPFRMLKFRTMVADAERQLSDLVSFDELAEPVFKFDSDPRVTRVGRFLRRTSLDELPQLLNVVRGQMSVVGPRPEQVELVERYRREHRFRLAVKPGVTGPMQVCGRGDLNFQERLAVEFEYVEHVSLARDLRILAETIPAALRGNGAY